MPSPNLLKLLCALAACLAALGSANVRAAPLTADVVVVVDESGSMAGEHAWLPGMIGSLDGQLIASGLTGNQYGLVGFGGGGVGNSGRAFDMDAAAGLQGFGTAAQFGAAAGGLVTSGGTEDGYAGINFTLSNYSFRPGAAVNFILVTDEDRDNTNGALTFNSILTALDGQNILLNAVVNNPFTCNSQTSLGVAANAAGFIADGAGGYNTCANTVIGNGAGTTETDYVALALQTGGAAWDLNQLRLGGNTAASFTAAFVDIKVQEIQQQIPEPGSLGLLGLALAGLAALRRRKHR
jgi:hypothetical protein